MSKILDLAKNFEQKSLEELNNTNQAVQSALEKHERDITAYLNVSVKNISNAIEQTSEEMRTMSTRLPEQKQELARTLHQTRKEMHEYQTAWMKQIKEMEYEQEQALKMQKEAFNSRLEEWSATMLQKQEQSLEEVEIAANNLLRRLFRPYWRGIILLSLLALGLTLVVMLMGFKINNKAEEIQLMEQKIEQLKAEAAGIQENRKILQKD